MKQMSWQQRVSMVIGSVGLAYAWVVLLGALLPAPAQACSLAGLSLVDATCAPPHGNGPDGRVWVRVACSDSTARLPLPYDWQLARLSGDGGDVFAWNANPVYAYVEAPTGSFQVSAFLLGGAQVSYNFTLPVASCSARPKTPRK